MRTLRYSRQWFVTDSEAAREWFEQADIPSEWRPQILNNLPQAARRAMNAESDG